MKNNINYLFDKKTPFLGFVSSGKEDVYFLLKNNNN